MNENATRSVNLTLLMIVSVCLPMLGALDAPAELDRAGERSETLANCQGPDACRGLDAGANSSSYIDLTGDFSWTGNETITYYGDLSSNYGGYSSTNADNLDGFFIDFPMGYGYTVDLSWNHSGVATWSDRAFGLSLNPGDGCAESFFGCDWGNSQGSTTGQIIMGTDGEQAGQLFGSWDYLIEPPIDLAGDSSVVFVWCYYCHQTGVSTDYTMNITVWTGDGGNRGDVTTPQYNILLDMPDEPSSWSFQTGTFVLPAGQQADLVSTYCDVWCNPETSIEVFKPDGTSDVFQLPDFFVGLLATYSDPGTYTVEKTDTWGDGGNGLTVGISIGNFSGLLSVDEFLYEDMASGHVSSTDETDVYAILLPENYRANLTLNWENSADLDLQLYTDYDPVTDTLSGLFEFSWFDQPEFIDIGQLGDETLFFAEVLHYSGPSTGYSLEYQTEPGSPPPCFFQDDGKAPGDGLYTGSSDATEGSFSPDDTPIDVTGVMGSDGKGVFQGMMCAGFDEMDWYQLSVPAGDGVHATLVWPEGIDTNFNDTIEIDGDIQFSLYMLRSSGTTSSVSSSYGFYPQAVATNESYWWQNDLGVDSILYFRLSLNSMTEDYESNYTVSFSMYNATEEPPEMACQNDAGMATLGTCVDAGQDQYTTLNLTTGNLTFTGYGHDEFDNYDYYKIFLPDNYGMEVCVEFPVHNDIDLVLQYVNPNWGWLSTVDSSYSDNPECAWAQYDDAGQDIYIRVATDVGSGYYDVTLSLVTPGLAPGDNQDDCGLAGSYPNGDASDTLNPGNWALHSFLNDSTEGDFNPYDANGDLRATWDGGTCTGWVDGTWDSTDHYTIVVPAGHYVNLTIDADPDGDGSDNAGVFHQFALYMCQRQHLPCNFATNNQAQLVGNSYFGSSTDTWNQNSGLWPVGQYHNASGITPNAGGVADTPGWLGFQIICSSCVNSDYEMTIEFRDISELEGGSQDDANSGRDAGTGLPSSVHVNDNVNMTANNTISWDGWTIGTVDTLDTYTLDVPANHGTLVELNHGYDVPDVWMWLQLEDASGGFLCQSAWTSGSQTCNISSASTTDTFMVIEAFNWGGYDTTGTNYTINVTFYTLDADGDGWLDQTEYECNTDPNDANSTPTDTDGDGICDYNDPDIDGDGVDNELDEMPLDENGSTDLDGDGVPDDVDPDVDGDGWSNIAEEICLGAASMADVQENVTPSDYDGDGLCDITAESDLDHNSASTYLDSDGDNDGTDDETDAFDFDECADTDTDRDGMPDSIDTNNEVCQPETPENLTEDTDDDGDGYDDLYEIDCGSSPVLASEMPSDNDGDELCDALDVDDDNDGVNDTDDLWPLDYTEWSDNDGDGQGDNRDMDDDNDGWWDSCDQSVWMAAQNSSLNTPSYVEGVNYFSGQPGGIASNCPGHTDAFPLDGSEWIDTDGDGVGNEADIDDDGQITGSAEAPGNNDWTDAEEIACGTDPLDHTSVPADNDGDYICDAVDTDDDGDGVPDELDAFPMDQTEAADADGDGIGDATDTDDDDDGWTDIAEASCLTDPMDTMDAPSDNDGDGECDLTDADDDNDGVIDLDDAFPNNPFERQDSDGDGIGDNTDNDDDGDGWLDAQEVACANAGGSGDKDSAAEEPVDLDSDGLCDAVDPDDDNDGFPDPACVNTGIGTPSQLAYVECAEGDEDRFPRDSAEWFDANEDQKGDNANPVTLIDNVVFDPAPYAGIAVAIGAAGYALLQMNRNAGQGTEDDAEDYTEDFEEFDFEEEDEPSEEEEDGEED